MPLGGDPVATGQAKVGCFIGDHTRTGLCSQLNTGTAIGVMCNVLPAGLLLPKHVPSFAAVCYGQVELGFGLEELFATARVVMGRRGREFDAVQEQLYLDLYERTRLERRAGLAEDPRPPRRPLARPVGPSLNPSDPVLASVSTRTRSGGSDRTRAGRRPALES